MYSIPESESLETHSDSGSFDLSESARDSGGPGASGRPESLTDSDKLVMARKYRLAAQTITNPQIRKQYLDKADSLASEVSDDSASENVTFMSGFEPESNGDSETWQERYAKVLGLKGDWKSDIADQESVKDSSPGHFPGDVKVHWKLASAILARKDANLDRAYALWAIARMDGQAWVYESDLIDLALITGKHERSVRRWLDAGENIFWRKGKHHGRQTLSLVGKHQVFDYFGLGDPGRVMRVNDTELLGSLQELRATLYTTWVSKNAKWASREKIADITSIQPRTQFNYEKIADLKSQNVFVKEPWIDEETGQIRQVRQLPNRYYASHFSWFDKHSGKRYGLRTTGFNVQGSPIVVKVSGRILFDNANSAKRKAFALQHKGITEGSLFSVLGETKKGKLLCKSLPIALATPVYTKAEQQ